jgi:hypothetical protein
MNERQAWSQRQRQLGKLLDTRGREQEALALALRQHAMVHAAALAQMGVWSFEDEVLEGLSDEQMRRRPARQPNSIAWLVWHMARIEDVTMNLLVAGQPQVLEREGWLERLRLVRSDVGTAMGDAEVAQVTEQIDLAAMRAYRLAVGRSTRQIIEELPPEALHHKVDQARIERLLSSSALAEGVLRLAEIWGGWKIGGLIKQPAIRHSFVHLNEARTLRQKSR